MTSISATSRLGRLIRAPLALIPSSTVVRVLRGPLRGARWVMGSSIHGCWLGTFEGDKQDALWAAAKPGDAVLDIGANVGFYTLLLARRVGPAGSVVAFEPLPRNLQLLRRHVEMNRLGNVQVVAAAVGERSGTARFSPGENPSEGRLAAAGSLEVEVVSLDELHDAGRIPSPRLLKIDIEGAELFCLRGARRLLEAARPTIFLATHGAQVHQECIRFLRALGYRVEGVGGRPLDSTDELVATWPA